MVSKLLIEKLIEKTNNSKDKFSKKAGEFLRIHREELEHFGDDTIKRFFGLVGQGETTAAADLLKMKAKVRAESISDLISGIEESGKLFEISDAEAMERAEKYNSMSQKIGIEAAKFVASALLALI